MSAYRTRKATSSTQPLDVAKVAIKSGEDGAGFAVKFIDEIKGRGVFATKNYSKGEFLLEYRGTLLRDDPTGDDTYIYEFQQKGRMYWIDATRDERVVCRYVNDSHLKPNAAMKVVVMEDRPHLALFALREIHEGDEVCYNYGRGNYPWRIKKNSKSTEPSLAAELLRALELEGAILDVNDDKAVDMTPFAFNAAVVDLSTSRPRRGFPSSFDIKGSGSCSTSEPTAGSGVEDLESPVSMAEDKIEDEVDSGGLEGDGEDQYEAECGQLAVKGGEQQSTQADTSSTLQVLSALRPRRGVPPSLGTEDKTEDEVDSGGLDEEQDEAECGQLAVEGGEQQSAQADTSSRLQVLSALRPRKGVPPRLDTEDKIEDEVDSGVLEGGGEEQDEAECGQLAVEGGEQHSTQADTSCKLQVLSALRPRRRVLPSLDIEDSGSCCSSDNDPTFDPTAGSEDENEEHDSESSVSMAEDTIEDELDSGGLEGDGEEQDEAECGQLELEGGEQQSTQADTSSGLQVMMVRPNSSRWDKKQTCPYCMGKFSKLPRHLERKHGDEREVVAALIQPKNSQMRKLRWEALRKKGNFMHNTDIIKSGSGSIIPYRRPSSSSSAKDYIPCPHCLGSYVKAHLWKHISKCKLRKDKKAGKSRPHEHQRASAALLPVNVGVKAKFRAVLDTLANDDIAFAVRKDALILNLGEKLYAKHGKNQHQHQYIKQKMRELARFLIQARDVDPSISSVADCIDPLKFRAVVEAVKKVTGYTEDGEYKRPSLAMKLGALLKRTARRFRSEGILTGDEAVQSRANAFLSLCDEEWEYEVTSEALGTMHKRTYNKPKRIPLGRDIKLLNDYMSTKAKELLPRLQGGQGDASVWRQLNEITMAQLTVINRRRSGEVERILISDYKNGMNNPGDVMEEISESLSDFERALCKRVSRLEIRGKRGRKVAVLLLENHKEQLQILTATRTTGNISEINPFLFPRPGESVSPLRGCDVLRQFSNECGATKPELLRSTLLRKHVAIITQLLNLKEHELDIVANFMGHDIRVHREYYRLPNSVLEIAKVSKLLMQVEKGKLQDYKGKSLDDILITEEDEVSENELEREHEDPDPVEPVHGPVDECSSVAVDDRNNTEAGTLQSKQRHMKKPSRKWTTDEKNAVEKHLGKFIRLQRPPRKEDCETCISSAAGVLQKRTWRDVKNYVHNVNSRGKRLKSANTTVTDC